MTSLTDIFVTVKPDMKSFGADAKRALGAASGLFRAAGKDAGKVYTDALAAASKAKIEDLGKKAAAASAVQADALGKLRVAEAKLDEVRSNSKAKASQLATAEEAVAAALRKSTAASGEAKTAASALTREQNKAKKAAEEAAKSPAKGGGNLGAIGNRLGQSVASAFKPNASALNKIDGTREGRALAGRFGGAFNNSLGGVVAKSAGLLGATFAAVGIGSVLKDSVNLEATFSQTMNTMAAVAKVPAGEMKGLSDLALKMGADTTFSAVEAGNAMLELAKGGLSAATIKSGGLQGTLTLAAAGGLSLASASTIAANAMNTFGLKGKDMGAIADALAGGANASTASVESLGIALGQVGPGATNAHLSLQQTVGVLAAFDNAGLKGSDAGTSLKTMLTRLVPQTDKAKGAMEDLGLKFTDARGAILPITNIAQQLKDKLGPLSDAQRTSALATIFGSDATRAATVLMKEGATGLGTYIKATSDNGAAQQVAAARMSGTAGALEQFKGSVETAKLQLGLFLAPAIQGGLKLLTEGVNHLAPAAQSVAGWFKDHLLPAATDIGNRFKDEVLPKVKEFGTYVRDEAAPALQTLVTKISQAVLPILEDMFKKFKDDVLPKVQEFGKYIIEKVVPTLSDMADYVKKNTDYFAPFAEAVLVLVAALWAWTIVQAILDAELFANPIGLVVLALAALIAALVLAYGKSETFRDIVNKVWAVTKVGIGLWWDFVKSTVTLFINIVVAMWQKVQYFGAILVAVFNAVKEPVRAALAFVVDQFLGFIGSMLTAAAQAFGWVPGIGGKLKTAASEFGKFRDATNRALAGISDQEVKITPIVLAAQQNRRDKNARQSGVGYATGGPVFGAGTATSDAIPAMLSNGEHVWTAREVQKAGGHGMVEQMRQTVMGFAKGGAVALNVKAVRPPLEGPIDYIARTAVAVARPIAQTLANKLAATDGPSGPPGSVRSFRGEKLNARTIAMLLSAEKKLGATFNIMQGSYSTRVAASGGTHSGGGAMDTDGPRGWSAAVSALRRVGFAAWHRTPAQGPWGDHIHSIAIGDPSASASAKAQVRDYKRGGDGLGGYSRGGKVGSLLFDGGSGYLPPGASVVQNNTGKPEPLTRTDQALDLSDQTIRALGNVFTKALGQGRFRLVNSGGGTYVLQASNG